MIPEIRNFIGEDFDFGGTGTPACALRSNVPRLVQWRVSGNHETEEITGGEER
jgi:hypothetical protein